MHNPPPSCEALLLGAAPRARSRPVPPSDFRLGMLWVGSGSGEPGFAGGWDWAWQGVSKTGGESPHRALLAKEEMERWPR